MMDGAQRRKYLFQEIAIDFNGSGMPQKANSTPSPASELRIPIPGTAGLFYAWELLGDNRADITSMDVKLHINFNDERTNQIASYIRDEMKKSSDGMSSGFELWPWRKGSQRDIQVRMSGCGSKSDDAIITEAVQKMRILVKLTWPIIETLLKTRNDL